VGGCEHERVDREFGGDELCYTLIVGANECVCENLWDCTQKVNFTV
jgi:hypothetical protein